MPWEFSSNVWFGADTPFLIAKSEVEEQFRFMKNLYLRQLACVF
jgi:hypothetical protein